MALNSLTSARTRSSEQTWIFCVHIKYSLENIISHYSEFSFKIILFMTMISILKIVVMGCKLFTWKLHYNALASWLKLITNITKVYLQINFQKIIANRKRNENEYTYTYK